MTLPIIQMKMSGHLVVISRGDHYQFLRKLRELNGRVHLAQRGKI